jgi:predicted RNase H-like nuclease (RuvC/YqgF family)
MTSLDEQQTQAQRDEDLDRQSTRMAQLAVEGAGLSAAVTRRTAHSKFQAQAHKDVERAKAEHTALKDGIYDAFIGGTISALPQGVERLRSCLEGMESKQARWISRARKAKKNRNSVYSAGRFLNRLAYFTVPASSQCPQRTPRLRL